MVKKSSHPQTTKNIVLIGFMGAGKSVTGKYLAVKLKREIVSTDEGIERKEGRAITAIFQESGEAYFRKCEEDLIADLSRRENLVIDCGGGIVLNKKNVARLKKTGILIYLKTSPEVVYQRLKHQINRPLLNTPNPQQRIQQLLDERIPLYQQAAYSVDTDGKTAEQVGDEILQLLLKK